MSNKDSAAAPQGMVERVARAICAAEELDWNEQSDPQRSGSGNDDTEAFRHMARAAIEAMREPTEEMAWAGWGAARWDVGQEGIEAPANVWTAMLTTALKD